jgi:hypothetical protein
MMLLKKLFGYASHAKSIDQAPQAQVEGNPKEADFPFTGFEENKVNSGFIEFISDDDLVRLNQMLPWKCFTADIKGRRFGNRAWKGKREVPQVIPDPRIVDMNRVFDLKDKAVLEVGCFEGVHTIGLGQFGARVHAVDSRIENVVKTLVRANLFGFAPHVFVCDLEVAADIARLPRVNYVHHVGVLYHLKDPVTHLLSLGAIASDGVLLDTHYATKEMLNGSYTVGGKEYGYYKYGEKGRDEVFSGMHDHAKWLLLDDIKEIMARAGFIDFRIVQDSQQRNGPRFTAFAALPGVMRG